MTKNRDELAINTLRMNGVAAVNAAKSGHPGIVLGAAPMLHTLLTRHLMYDPQNPKWVNRDRLILSAGHGSALLYSALRLLGFVSTEDLKAFRQLGSKTPGHPEFGHTTGVEATTGPLGQGLAMAVGLALAETSLHASFPEINHYVYAICGDGDMQEGVSMEAMSFAGMQKLNKLIVLYDSNDVQLDTMVNKVFADNMGERMKALGFYYELVKSNTVDAIDAAIKRAKASQLPSLLEIKTIIGEGATKQNSPAVHGAPLGEDIAKVRTYYNWTHGDFDIPEEVTALYRETIFARGHKAFASWKASEGLTNWLKPIPKIALNNLELKKDDATRNLSGSVVHHLNDLLPQWIGGSADLSGSTKAAGGNGEFSQANPKGRNILFGVREFAMAAICNGLALHSNFRPFASTFLVFSDYLKPAIRMASIMELPVTYVFTHDSIFVGEDGPTHQPIEHNAMLRSIPGVNFVRPADGAEVLGAYELALNSKHPTVIALTRQNTKTLATTSAAKLQSGLYYVRTSTNKAAWTLVASGSELANAVAIGEKLNLNVVSISHFKGEAPYDISRAIAIEAAASFGLHKYARHVIGIDTFGASGEGNAVYAYFKLDQESVLKRIETIIAKH